MKIIKSVLIALILIMFALSISEVVLRTNNYIELADTLDTVYKVYCGVVVFVLIILDISYFGRPNDKCSRGIICTLRTEKHIRKCCAENSDGLAALTEVLCGNESSIVRIVRSDAFPRLDAQEHRELSTGYRMDSDKKVSEADIAACSKCARMLSEWGVKSVERTRDQRTLTSVIRLAFAPKKWAPLKELWFVNDPQGPKSVYKEGIKKQERLGGDWYLVTLEWVPDAE